MASYKNKRFDAWSELANLSLDAEGIRGTLARALGSAVEVIEALQRELVAKEAMALTQTSDPRIGQLVDILCGPESIKSPEHVAFAITQYIDELESDKDDEDVEAAPASHSCPACEVQR